MENHNNEDNSLEHNHEPVEQPPYNQGEPQGAQEENNPIGNLDLNELDIHEDEIGEDGNIEIDLEIEEDEDEEMNEHGLFPWEVEDSESSEELRPGEQEAQSRVSIHEAAPEPVTLTQEAYYNLITERAEFQDRVIELQAQVERRDTEIRLMRMGRMEDREEFRRQQNEIRQQWLETRNRLEARERENNRLRAIIANIPP